MTKINIAILMTVHNRKEKTLSCLERLHELDHNSNYQMTIFITDDASSDGTRNAIRSKYPEVVIINGTGDLFWNRGMHLAWDSALKANIDFDYFLWLNDDTYLFPEAINKLLFIAEEKKDSIIVGSTISILDSSDITYGGYLENQLIRNFRSPFVECDFFNGNIVLVPNSVVEKIGILDPHFHHSFGDFEYGKRAKKNGIKSYVIVPIGACERNSPYVKWMNPNISVFKRLKNLYSPLGFNPLEAFRIKRYDSSINACFVFIYLHLKAIFPRLFKQHRK